MIKLYLDNCCYNRPFDDLSQEKISLEASAIEFILREHLKNELKIYKSLAIDFEISKIKDGNKKKQVENLYDSLNLLNVEYTNEIRKRAVDLRQYNIKDMDALHIAFAESAKVDYMITTDRILINASKRVELTTKLLNPVNFVMEVM